MEMRFPFGHFFAMSVALTTLASGCSTSKTKTPDGEESVSSTSSAAPILDAASIRPAVNSPSCGGEVQTHGQGYDDAARACLWNAYQAGRPAELALTRHTIEGDPITVTIQVRSKTLIEVVEDNSDRFGARGHHHSVCKVLERTPTANGRSGFVARGCATNAETITVQ